jgi:cyclohexadieny/prephenate dehydrogenase
VSPVLVDQKAGSDLGRIAIVGAGQIGTMLGVALRNAGCAEVFIHDRDAAVADVSFGLGVATGRISRIEEALEFDTLVLALPVPEIVRFLEVFGPQLKPGSFLMDTGSAKGAVTAAMRKHVPGSVHAIGGHPMAGSARPGPTGSRPEMLKGATFVFSPVREDQVALDRARLFAALIGAKVAEVDAETHDAVLARSSHVAHVTAFALASLGDPSATDEAAALFSPGYQGATRLAGSDPQMVAGFLHANASNVRRAIEELIARLEQASETLVESPRELEMLLARWQNGTAPVPATPQATRP